MYSCENFRNVIDSASIALRGPKLSLRQLLNWLTVQLMHSGNPSCPYDSFSIDWLCSQCTQGSQAVPTTASQLVDSAAVAQAVPTTASQLVDSAAIALNGSKLSLRQLLNWLTVQPMHSGVTSCPNDSFSISWQCSCCTSCPYDSFSISWQCS